MVDDIFDDNTEQEALPQPAAAPPTLEPYRMFAIRTTVGKENTVAEFIANRVKKSKIPLSSILTPVNLRGYVVLEVKDRDEALRAIHGISNVRGILKGEIVPTEVGKYLEAKTTREIPLNALVELISGPFKGEKAKITRVDKTKEEVTLELIEATVPIPITVKWDAIRVLEESADVLRAREGGKHRGD